MKTETHTQCRLVNDDGRVQVSWIPTKFAVVGRRLQLREGERRADSVWEEGWCVEEVYNTQPSDLMVSRERGWTKQRSVSDI